MNPGSVAIVGAGVVGCLTAREIVGRAPGMALTVLDRDAIGSGASRRSAGLHLPRGASSRLRSMAAYSQEYYRALAHEVGPEMFQAVPATLVAPAEAQARLACEYLEESDLRSSTAVPAPLRTLPAGASAWAIDGCQSADVTALAHCVAERLRSTVSFREGVAVTGLEADRHQVFLHLSTGRGLIVDRVVLAPGPWIHAPAWRELVAPLGLRIKKIVAVHVAAPVGPADQAVIFPDEDAFLLPLPSLGYWLFSYTCDEWDVDPDALLGGLSAHDVDAAREVLDRYAPGLADLVGAGRVFCDAYSPEREPRIESLDEAGRIVFVGAANGSGYRLAPAMAAEVADLIRLRSDARSRG
jgi:glycine/D-amino acid oxidase-like deaminating enzyme